MMLRQPLHGSQQAGESMNMMLREQLSTKDAFENHHGGMVFKIMQGRGRGGGTGVAQSVRCPTLGFGSARDLGVSGFKPHIRLHAGSVEPACDSLSLRFSLPLPCSFTLSK